MRPDPVVGTTTVADADASAAGAVLDLIREIEVVLQTLSAAPVPELRSGGLGVREAKRLSKLTGIDEQRLGLVLEVCAAAGLIASGLPDPEPPDTAGPYWAPTVAADRFLDTPTAARWHLLASTWLDLPARPGLIGSRGPDGKPYAALSDSLYSTAAPLDRRLLFGLLAELPPGSGVDARHAAQALIWQRPRWAARLQPGPVEHLLDEAHAVGLIGRGALSTPARALLARGENAAIEAMAKVLPAPIDHFLVQADLTVVVPGPLQRDLAEELAAVAIVESAGAAMVYRVSEQSIRHALDTGRTAGALHTFFEKHSKTPVPQGLSYLINDVARRHGQLRVGMASSFVRARTQRCSPARWPPRPSGIWRCGCSRRRSRCHRRRSPRCSPHCAPPASPRPPRTPRARSWTFSSAGHGCRPRSSGGRSARCPSPSPDTLAAVVSMLRRVDSAPFANVRLDPAVAMALLQQAAHGTQGRGDRLRRCRRSRHPAGGASAGSQRWPIGGLRRDPGAAAGVRRAPGDIGDVGRSRIMAD